jgi:hypothetical protein
MTVKLIPRDIPEQCRKKSQNVRMNKKGYFVIPVVIIWIIVIFIIVKVIIRKLYNNLF